MTKQSNKKSEKDHAPILLIQHGMRPTRQRLALAAYLFDGCHKHVTAEQVMEAVKKRRARVSLATVYNTLHQFTQAGLLREIMVNEASNYYDTNTSAHYHFFDEVTGHLCDIPSESFKITSLPLPPAGRKISSVDVTVRLAKAR